MYRSISYKQPESSLSDGSNQHWCWILSSYLSGIHISDDCITHVGNSYIFFSNISEQPGEKILLNRPENRILQNVIWEQFLMCSPVEINFKLPTKQSSLLPYQAAECIMSVALINGAPEILCVDRHP